jgi:GTP-binding protein HflX
LPALSQAVSDALTAGFVEIELRLPVSDGKTIAWLASHAEVLSKQYHDDFTLVHCRMPKGAAGKLAGQGFEMRVLAGKLPEPSKRGLPDRATFLPASPEDGEDSPASATEDSGLVVEPSAPSAPDRIADSSAEVA